MVEGDAHTWRTSSRQARVSVARPVKQDSVRRGG